MLFPGGTSADGPVISEVRWDTDMYGPVARKLVNESHSK